LDSVPIEKQVLLIGELKGHVTFSALVGGKAETVEELVEYKSNLDLPSKVA